MKLEEIEKIYYEATIKPWQVEYSMPNDPIERRLKSLGPISYWAAYAADGELDIPEEQIKFIILFVNRIIPKLLAVAKAAKAYADRQGWRVEGEESSNLFMTLQELGKDDA